MSLVSEREEVRARMQQFTHHGGHATCFNQGNVWISREEQKLRGGIGLTDGRIQQCVWSKAAEADASENLHGQGACTSSSFLVVHKIAEKKPCLEK
jgi:hypothetical protein